jgi:hypothetical protein
MSKAVRSSRQLYSVVVKLYPATLRRTFAAEMLDVFEAQLAEAWIQDGVFGLMQVWSCVITEVMQGPAPRRLLQTLISVPAISLLSSSVLFLLFFWAGGFAGSCP